MYFYLSADQMTRFRLTVKPRLTREENLVASSYRKHDLRTFQFDSEAHVPITERSVAHTLHIHMAGADCMADSIAQASRLKGTFKRSDVHSHRDGLHKAAYKQEQDTAYIWCIWLISMPSVLEIILSSSRFCLDEHSYGTTRNSINFHISASGHFRTSCSKNPSNRRRYSSILKITHSHRLKAIMYVFNDKQRFI